jgi:hypothetical protein
VIEDSPQTPLHFRSTSPDEVHEIIDLTADSDDEGAVVLPLERFPADNGQLLDEDKRECPICTFHNHVAMSSCEMCGAELPPSPVHAAYQDERMLAMDRALALRLQREEDWEMRNDWMRVRGNGRNNDSDRESDVGSYYRGTHDVDDFGTHDGENMYISESDGTTTTLDTDEIDGSIMSTDEDDFSGDDVIIRPRIFVPRRTTNDQTSRDVAIASPQQPSGKCDICLEVYDRLVRQNVVADRFMQEQEQEQLSTNPSFFSLFPTRNLALHPVQTHSALGAGTHTYGRR